MTTDQIINACLYGVGEQDPTTPQAFTRVQVLAYINKLYQNDIGRRLKILTSYSYDASDAAHTITAGVGTLPTDFLGVAQVYDGDAPDDAPLTQIFGIEDKVDDDVDTIQYMIPNLTTLWIFGTTPTNTVKLYYYQKPTALTDDALSSPVHLKEEFHVDIFVAEVKRNYAINFNNTYDALDQLALIQDYLDQIAAAHGPAGKRDDTPETIKPYYGGFD